MLAKAASINRTISGHHNTTDQQIRYVHGRMGGQHAGSEKCSPTKTKKKV
jgi:hypothetical protein